MVLNLAKGFFPIVGILTQDSYSSRHVIMFGGESASEASWK